MRLKLQQKHNNYIKNCKINPDAAEKFHSHPGRNLPRYASQMLIINAINYTGTN